jgi:hypothetical protein
VEDDGLRAGRQGAEAGKRRVARAGHALAGMFVGLADVDEDRAFVDQAPGGGGGDGLQGHGGSFQRQ